jgi:hypothetical protein
VTLLLRGAEVALFALFLVSGIAKLRAPSPTVASLRIVVPVLAGRSRATVAHAVRALGAAEVVLGLAILLDGGGTVMIVAATTLLCFGGYTFAAYRKNASCGCFAKEEDAKAAGPVELARNAILFFAAGLAALQSQRAGEADVAVVAVLGAAVAETAVVLVVLAAVAAVARRRATAPGDGRDSKPVEAPTVSRRALLTGAGAVAGYGGLSLLGNGASAALKGPPKAGASETRLVATQATASDTTRLAALLRDELTSSGVAGQALEVDWTTVQAGRMRATRGDVLGESYDLVVVALVREAGWVAFSPDLVPGGFGLLSRDGGMDDQLAWNGAASYSLAGLTECQRCALETVGISLGAVGTAIGCASCAILPNPPGCISCAAGAGSTAIGGVLYGTGTCPNKCRGANSYASCVAVQQAFCPSLGCTCSSPYPGPCQCKLCDGCDYGIYCPEGCSGVIGGPICVSNRELDGNYCGCFCCCPSTWGFAESELSAQDRAELTAQILFITKSLQEQLAPAGAGADPAPGLQVPLR